MKHLSLLLLLFTNPLWGETQVAPKPGTAVGFVKVDDPGKWIVLAADLTPVKPTVLEGGRVCIFEGGTGRYAVIRLPAGDAQPDVFTIILGAVGPVPTPTPIPPSPTPTPTPVPPPSPSPVTPTATGLQVLIVEEIQDRSKLPRSQLGVLESSVLRQYLTAHCAYLPPTNQVAWRMWDQNTKITNPVGNLTWQTLLAQPRQSLPWIYLVQGADKGGAYYSGPLPQTVDDTLALLRKYGGD